MAPSILAIARCIPQTRLRTPVRIDALRIFVPIEGDVDGNGCVDDANLPAVLFAFGGNDPLANVNGDDIVDDADLLMVLFNFGTGC